MFGMLCSLLVAVMSIQWLLTVMTSWLRRRFAGSREEDASERVRQPVESAAHTV